MKILLLLLTFTTLSFGQSVKSRDLMANKAPCTFEMTIEQLTSDKLNFKCPEVFENKPFGIQNFKMKFPGKPTIAIDGNSLNDASKIIVKSLKTGDIITIYDIQNINILKLDNKEYNTLLVKIVD